MVEHEAEGDGGQQARPGMLPDDFQRPVEHVAYGRVADLFDFLSGLLADFLILRFHATQLLLRGAEGVGGGLQLRVGVGRAGRCFLADGFLFGHGLFLSDCGEGQAAQCAYLSLLAQ